MKKVKLSKEEKKALRKAAKKAAKEAAAAEGTEVEGSKVLPCSQSKATYSFRVLAGQEV